MGSVAHKSKVVWVKAYVDEGVAEMVTHLNTIDGVLTHTSCQGTIGEGGPYPYPPFVQVSWTDEAAKSRILKHYDLEDHEGNSNWAYAHPKTARAPSAEYKDWTFPDGQDGYPNIGADVLFETEDKVHRGFRRDDGTWLSDETTPYNDAIQFEDCQIRCWTYTPVPPSPSVEHYLCEFAGEGFDGTNHDPRCRKASQTRRSGK